MQPNFPHFPSQPPTRSFGKRVHVGGSSLRGRAGNAAFTLVEMVMVLAFLGALSLLVYRMFESAQRFYVRGGEKLESIDNARDDRARAQRQVAAARPWPSAWPEISEEQFRQFYFHGESGVMEFVTAVSLAQPTDGQMRLVRWEIPGEGQRGLQISERLLLPYQDGEGPAPVAAGDALEDPSRVLPYRKVISGSLSLGEERSGWKFSYLAFDLRSARNIWVDRWSPRGEDRLPRAVRISGFDADSPTPEHAFEWIFPLPNRNSGWPPYHPEVEKQG